ncbi:MAG: hypothetical protein K9L62_16870 [Vallitaleaceae bacterium]|nr:hypothetical protein [Vallitaleaceae bacterium]
MDFSIRLEGGFESKSISVFDGESSSIEELDVFPIEFKIHIYMITKQTKNILWEVLGDIYFRFYQAPMGSGRCMN